MDMANLKNRSRVDNAYDRQREGILENLISPDYQAPASDIALRLGMSRTPVGEALLKLESEGLVEMIPRRGVGILKDFKFPSL